jgi:hypothetical protein
MESLVGEILGPEANDGHVDVGLFLGFALTELPLQSPGLP